MALLINVNGLITNFFTEAEWNVQKGEYEKFIQSLKSEISSRRGILSPVKSPQKVINNIMYQANLTKAPGIKSCNCPNKSSVGNLA